MKINILGNSHVVALDMGRKALSEQMDLQGISVSGANGNFEKECFSFEQDAGVFISYAALARGVRAMTGTDCIRKEKDRLWGMSMGHIPFLFRNRVWRRHTPYHLARANRRQLPLSSAVYEQIVLAHFSNVLAFFEQLKHCGVGFFVIASPFPRRNIDLLEKRLLSPELLLDIDRKSRSLLQNWLQKRGIPLLEAPAQTKDAEGFMLEQFCAGPRPDGREDPHHANGDYGELVIRQILEKYPLHAAT